MSLPKEVQEMLWPFAWGHDPEKKMTRLTCGFNNWVELSDEVFQNANIGNLLHAVLAVMIDKAIQQHGRAEVLNYIAVMYKCAETPLISVNLQEGDAPVELSSEPTDKPQVH